ncbi:MAG: hypothetical protein ABII80_01270 [bacterium]
MAENSPELIPPPSIGDSNAAGQVTGGKEKTKSSKIWIVILLCVVIGVGLGIYVYQKSLVPKTVTPTSTPVPVVTPKPAVVKTPTPTPKTTLPATPSATVKDSTESASLLDPSPIATGGAEIAEINLVDQGMATGSATPSASLKASPTASASARITMPEGSALPDAGVFEVTAGTVGVGAVLILLGILGLLVL